MDRTLSLLALLGLLAVCLSSTASCGSATVAEAAPLPHGAAECRTEFRLVQKDGTEHVMEIYGWSHEVVSPRDAASGLPTGTRQHKPISVSKPTDKSSPLLMKALVDNEVFTEGTLTCYQVRNGREEPVLIVTFEECFLCSWRPSEGSVDNADAQHTHATREHIAFCYQRIGWAFPDSGQSFIDDWASESSI